MDPTVLHEMLDGYLKNQSIKHVMVFQNIEGSIVAKATQKNLELDEDGEKSLNSYAAVLANICHEYIEFGLEAFDNNKFK